MLPIHISGLRPRPGFFILVLIRFRTWCRCEQMIMINSSVLLLWDQVLVVLMVLVDLVDQCSVSHGPVGLLFVFLKLSYVFLVDSVYVLIVSLPVFGFILGVASVIQDQMETWKDHLHGILPNQDEVWSRFLKPEQNQV